MARKSLWRDALTKRVAARTSCCMLTNWFHNLTVFRDYRGKTKSNSKRDLTDLVDAFNIQVREFFDVSSRAVLGFECMT